MHRPIPEERMSEILRGLKGLTAADVESQRARFGRNDILETPRNAWWDLVRETARDPMLWFLLISSGLYAIIGEVAESLTLLAAILPFVGMDAYLHHRSRASTTGLRERLASESTVTREGAALTIPAEDLVPLDLVTVTAGENFPADGVLVAGDAIQVDESSLTGEAYPVPKQILAVREFKTEGPLKTKDPNWAFAGTRLLTGQATVRVIWTGEETLYGEIVGSVQRGAHDRTPLQRAIAQLVGVLLIAAASLCALLASVRLWQGFGWTDALLSAMTLAIAALPEEFSVVFSMFLGIGVIRLARRKALVRRAVSVEDIGRVTCICSDKTGTLTRGELSLSQGIPNGETTTSALKAAAASAARRESHDPLDEAIFRWVDEDNAAPEPKDVVATFPFTEDRRRETSVTRLKTGFAIATKGAPETVLSLCDLTQEEHTRWKDRADALAREGQKVIACATQTVDTSAWTGNEPKDRYHFAGLLALEDPLREEAPDAIAKCRDGGIRVIMLTGDHPETAVAIARQLGLGDGDPKVVSGDDIATLLSTKGGAALIGIDVVARCTPSEKLAIVLALKASGECVALTGDGVNDVPALRAADVGIAMGQGATRSARETAAIVLLDDNFLTITRAIAEGRQLFHNLTQSFHYLLLIHIPLVATAAVIPIAGFPILYLPIHVIWIELIIHPSALLAFQDAAPRDSLGPRRVGTGSGFFSRREWVAIGLVGIAAAGMILLAYLREIANSEDADHARSVALLLLNVTSATLVSVLSGLRTVAARVIAALTLISAATIMSVKPIASILHLSPLHLSDWGLAALTGAVLSSILLLAIRMTRVQSQAPTPPPLTP